MAIKHSRTRFSKRNLLLSGEKASTTRRALLLLPHEQEPEADKGLLKAIDRLYSERSKIQQTLEETLEKIEEATDLIFPRFKIDLRRKTVKRGDVKAAFEDLEEKATIRLVADFTSASPDSTALELAVETAGVSHVVTFIDAKKMHGWAAGAGASDANVKTSLDRLSLLVTDIVLDIAMFHSWPFLRETRLTLKDKRAFSAKKVQFAKERNLTSFYGRIDFEGLQYFCLASCVRRGTTFSSADCKNYEELWRDFLRDEIVGPIVSVGSVEREMERISRSHVRGGQISRRKLSESIASLGKGDYVLMIAARRPKGDKEYRRLLAAFRRSSWKTNAWVIEPLVEIGRYIRFHPFVYFWRFSVG
ncbi:MAG: hypothetical protein QOH06_343 [Acidobacteriota bacterium]|nr:hypothetical protein [Acidobacteriota bacterium]